MYNTRRSNRVTSGRIRKLLKQQTGRKRAVFFVNDTLQFVDGSGETTTVFMENFQRDAALVQSFTIDDGTFINMYAYPDHATDEDYILNVGATRLRLPDKGAVTLFESDDNMYESKYVECLVHGHVLFQRVDEDGMELGLKREHLQCMFESNSVIMPNCI